MKKSYLTVIFLAYFIFSGVTFASPTDKYVCYPCGGDCDIKVYDAPGKCDSCGMELIESSKVKLQSFSPDELCGIISENKEFVLLDVRTAAEYESKGDTTVNSYGHLRTALNISSKDIKNRLGEIEQFREKDIIVYCARGHRSATVSQYLTENGFHHVKNLLGGMELLTAKKDLDCIEKIIEK